MRIDRLDIWHVAMPLIYPWRTAYDEDYEIHSVLVKATSGDIAAWSESSPLEAPTLENWPPSPRSREDPVLSAVLSPPKCQTKGAGSPAYSTYQQRWNAGPNGPCPAHFHHQRPISPQRPE